MSEKELTRLIILGAGASVDCGVYPTGAQFVEIAEKILLMKTNVPDNSPGRDWSLKNTASEEICESLKKLISANPSSIDAYISGINSQKEKLLLKALIVSILRVCTTYSEAFPEGFKNNWYFSVWQLIELDLRNCSNDEEKIEVLENSVFRIITFNYDISLELFLWKRIRDNFNDEVKQKKALEIIATKIITHVYGQIDDWRGVVNNQRESGDYSNCSNLEFEDVGKVKAQYFDMTTFLSKGHQALTRRVLQLLEKILTEVKKEESVQGEQQLVVTELLNDICVIGHERGEIKKEVNRLVGLRYCTVYVLGYGFDHANNKLIKLKNIHWQNGCFVTNFKKNERSERVIYNELSRPMRENNPKATDADGKREFRLPLISEKSVKEALGKFSLLEAPEAPDVIIKTDLTPYIAMQK